MNRFYPHELLHSGTAFFQGTLLEAGGTRDPEWMPFLFISDPWAGFELLLRVTQQRA